jgi:hypothetical protein
MNILNIIIIALGATLIALNLKNPKEKETSNWVVALLLLVIVLDNLFLLLK